MRLNANTAPITSNIGLTKIPVIWIHNRAHTDTHSLNILVHTDTRSLYYRTNTGNRSLYNRAHTDTRSFCFLKSGSHRYPSLHNGVHKDTYHFIIGITKIPFASQIGMKKIPLGFGFYFQDTPSRRATISTQEKGNEDTKCLLPLNAKRYIILDKLKKVLQTISPPARAVTQVKK